MKKLMLLIVLSLITIIQVSAKTNTTFTGKAVDGKDIIELYNNQTVIDGKSEFEYEHDGARYLFSSKKNLELFKSNPKKYAPAYGGYCAWAVSQGYTAGVDLNTAKVVDGVLYLNYNSSIAAKWSGDQKNLIKKANSQWPDLTNN